MEFTMEEFWQNKKLWELLKRSVVIYPTDTVYGIGCNAHNKELVERIYVAKLRPKSKPLSVIAPGMRWILEHCECKSSILRKFLPGPYTLILRKKEPSFLKEVAPGNSLGVRIPAHLIAKIVEALGIPLVTTSANLSGEKAPASLEEIDERLFKYADIVINGGRLPGKPSTIVDLRGERVVIRKRG